MKLSFSTLGCPEWNWDKILNQAEAMGFDGVEVRGVGGELDNERIGLFWEPNLPSTLQSLRAHHLSIPCLDTSCSFLSTETGLEETVRAGKAAVDIAWSLGAPYIRVFGDRIPQGVGMGEQTAVSVVAEGLQEIAAYAECKGVSVLLEAHGNFADSRMLISVFGLVKSPAVGVLWDIANPCEFGETAERTWRRIGSLVRHVHIKDITMRNGGLVPCQPGLGRVPIGTAVRLLREAGYGGWLSFEWEKRWFPKLPEPAVAFPAFIEYIRQFL